MKFDAKNQQDIAELIATKLGVKVLQTKVRTASQVEDVPHKLDVLKSKRPDRHQLALLMECGTAIPRETIAFLFNCVPDRVYHKTFQSVDESALRLMEALNFHVQDRLSEDGDNSLSTMVFPPELDKQPPDFPNKFFVLVDLYF